MVEKRDDWFEWFGYRDNQQCVSITCKIEVHYSFVTWQFSLRVNQNCNMTRLGDASSHSRESNITLCIYTTHKTLYSILRPNHFYTLICIVFKKSSLLIQIKLSFNTLPPSIHVLICTTFIHKNFDIQKFGIIFILLQIRGPLSEL